MAETRAAQHPAATDAPASASEPHVLIERTFDAPRELVFRAWVERDRLVRWFAPHGCSLEVRAMDVREGGAFHFRIRDPRHGDCWTRGVFREVRPPERLAYTISFSDERGNFVEPSAAGRDADWPREALVTVTFASTGEGGTRVTLRQAVSEAAARRTGAYPSWLEMLDRLADELGAANGRG